MSHKKAKERRADNKRKLNALFHRYIAGLRAIFAADAPAYYADNPEARRPCHSCALNPSTDDWPGFDSTMLNLEAGIRKGEFLCHEPLPRDETGQWHIDEEAPRIRCAGYEVLSRNPATLGAFVRAVVGPGATPADAAKVEAVVDHSLRRRGLLAPADADAHLCELDEAAQ